MSKSVTERINSSISQHGLLASLRNIEFQIGEDATVTITGTVASFHMKQMAQEIVIRVEGVNLVKNDVLVAEC